MMSQGSTANDTRLPVRWVVMFTGSTATADYQPAASAAESPQLVKEVTDLCVAFHPHVDIRLFPQEGEALLFWKARTTGDWVITRVTTAPNPQGARIALEYCSLVFADADFAKLSYNPFRARDYSLHDQVRQQFLGQREEPLAFEVPEDPHFGTLHGSNGSNGVGGNGVGAAFAGPANGPALSEDRLSSPANYDALRAYCEGLSAAPDGPRLPVTFASWWSSHGEPPGGYFDIVLRAAAPKPLDMREGTGVVQALVAQTKESLPNAPANDANALALSQSIFKKADEISASVNNTASRVNTETADGFRARLEEAAALSKSVADDLSIYQKRLEAGLTTGDSARLDELINRYELLYRELPKIRHPNPFAVRPSGNTEMSRTSPSKSGPKNDRAAATTSAAAAARTGKGGFNPALAVAIIAALAAVGWAAFKAVAPKTPPGNGKPAKASPGPKSAPRAVVGGSGAGGAKAGAQADPIQAILTKYEDAIVASAKRRASEDARDAGAETEEGISNAQVQRITVQAVRRAYRSTLSGSDYRRTFGAREWDYDRLEQVIGKTMSDVYAAARLAATEATAERIQKKASQAKADADRQREQQQREEQQRREEEQQRQAAASRSRNTNSNNSDDGGSRRRRRRSDSDGDEASRPRRSSGGGSSSAGRRSSGGGSSSGRSSGGSSSGGAGSAGSTGL